MVFVRAGNREVAGVSGQEVIEETESRPANPRRWGSSRTMVWEHDQYGPQLSVQLEADAGWRSSAPLDRVPPRGPAVAAWDALLDSFKPARP